MNARNNIILAIVLFIMVISFIIYEKINNAKLYKPKTLVEDFQENEIFKIIIKDNVNKSKINIQRKNGIWHIIEPFKDYAQNEIIDKFLKKVSECKIVETFAYKDFPIKKVGLDSKNYLSVELFSSINKHNLRFGNNSAIENTTYSYNTSKYSQKSSIMLVDFDIKKYLPKKLVELRNKKLTNINPDNLVNISIVNQIGSINIARKSTNEQWQIQKPLQAIASKKTINEFVNKLNNISIIDFISEEQALSQNLTFSQNSSQITLVSKINDKYYETFLRIHNEKPSQDNTILVRNIERNGVLKISTDILDVLNKSTNYFREKSLLNTEAEKINSITIQKGKDKKNIILIKDNNSWYIVDKHNFENADKVEIDKFINFLSTQKIKSFVSATATEFSNYQLNNPLIAISVSYKKNSTEKEETYTIQFSPVINGISYINQLNTSFVSSVRKEIPEYIINKLYTHKWLSKLVFPHPVSHIKDLDLSINKGSKLESQIALKQDYVSTSWSITSSTSKVKDSKKVNLNKSQLDKLLNSIEHMKVLSWLEDPKVAIKEISKPQITLKMNLHNLPNINEGNIKNYVINFAPVNNKKNVYYGKINYGQNVFMINSEDILELLNINNLLKEGK